MRALLLAISLAGPLAAQDRCAVACDVVTTGQEAAARAEAALGAALPEGAAAVGLVEGGFQDAFVQARLEVEREAMAATLKRLGVERATVGPRPVLDLGPPGPPWWEEARRGGPGSGLWFGPASLPRFAHAAIGMGPSGDGEGYTVLVWAFQT